MGVKTKRCPKVLNEHKPLNFKHKAQKKNKSFRTKPKWLIKIWVPKSVIIDVENMLKKKGKAEVMVHGQWLLTTHDGRKVYVPNPSHERGRNYGIYRKPDCKIIGMWTIGIFSFYINNVWFINGLKHNLLSLSQFCDNGYDVMFDKSNCTIINKNDKSLVFKGKRKNNVYKINFLELTDQKVVCLL